MDESLLTIVLAVLVLFAVLSYFPGFELAGLATVLLFIPLATQKAH